MTKTSNIIVLGFLCLIFTNPLSATRYDYIQINEPVVNAINNAGSVVGTNIDGKPYVRHRDNKTMTYPDEADVALEDRVFNILLPTDFDNSEIGDADNAPIVNVDYTEIHVLDINNEVEEGGGGTIVGWYIGADNLRHSVLWYQEENERKIIQYFAVTLPPHTAAAFYCTGNPEEDFLTNECMFREDSDLIYRATQCDKLNENWEMPNNIFVDKNYRYTELVEENEDDPDNPIITPPESPDCSSANTVPICAFKAEKLPDGTKTVQGEDGPEERPAFKYVLNPNYNNALDPSMVAEQPCILKEHADIVVQAIACKNQIFKKAGDLITTKCDVSSKAIGINNVGVVIGVSDTPEGNSRPVIWKKGDKKTADGKPIYSSGDLGEKRTSVASTLEPSETGGIIGDEVSFEFRTGFPTSIDKSTNSVTGLLNLNETDNAATPVFWNGVTVGEITLPSPLIPPNPGIPLTQTCSDPNDPPSGFTTKVMPTSSASGNIVGWYEDEESNPQAIMWTLCPSKDENNVVTEKLKAGHLPALDTSGLKQIGQSLDNSEAGETIGTTRVEITDDSGNATFENHAFYRTPTCGIQDFNVLLAEPITDRSLIMESAYFIAKGLPPTPVLALGKTTESGNVNPYVLTPTKVFADLKISLTSNNQTLTVGDQHSINILVTNNGAVDNESTSNYATCIFFKLSATVNTQTTYEDKIKEAQANNIAITDELRQEFDNYPKIQDELVGGLTFDEFDNSNPNIICFPSVISITCAMERLNAGEAVEITVKTTPRPLLADRVIRTTVTVFSTESETPDSLLNNVAFELIEVEREGCFIATAAYGSYLAPEVKTLRLFRDNVLLTSTLGKHFVDFYYDISPPLANIIANNEPLKLATRWILSPLVYAVLYPLSSLVALMLLVLIYRKTARLRNTQRAA